MRSYMDRVSGLFGEIFEREPVEAEGTLTDLAGAAALVR
jgi:hypothetical protein